MAFPCLTVVLILMLIFTLRRHQVDNEEKQQKEQYWKRENEANMTRRKDISALPYLQIPLDTLPFGANDSPEALEAETTIQEVSQEKILNLTGISNTDLKLTYGAPNLNILTICDMNFTRLARALNDWGQCLAKNQQIEEAIQVLAYAVSCKTDISATYLTLAKLYIEQGESSQIESLIEAAGDLNSLSKEAIIRHLSEFVHTCQ